MDKKYQDIRYINKSNPFTGPEFEWMVWGVREVELVSISFGTEHMWITYCNDEGKHITQKLKKLPYHKLIID